MPRRKPASAKQRKAQLQEKRAIKRGDIPVPPPQPKPHGRKGPGRSALEDPLKEKDPSSKRLQSAFLKVEPAFLERSRQIASNEALSRSLSADAVILREQDVGLSSDSSEAAQLTCPRRPKWRFDMSKKEVEANEEGLYKKWIAETDEHIKSWMESRSLETSEPEQEDIPGSPTYYERNLEVWRQLWRVTEISQIMLVLLDSRCPALHFPPSLRAYLASLRPNRPLIIVLTKADMVPEAYSNAWKIWLQERYPSARIVKARSYREHDPTAERKGQGQRRKFEPEIGEDELRELVDAMKAAHKEIITPSEKIRNDEEKLANWKPTALVNVDWNAVLKGDRAELFEHGGDEDSPEFLTIGLIGQPNVGKSSLLNALFGAHKVKASRTPGKTKHFQTLFWTKQIRLVDCPGLVMPNYVPMELQVLGATLPISQIPSIPSCLHFILNILPLERVLHLEHPSARAQVIEDKRTWRGDKPARHDPEQMKQTWTTMDVLTAYATKKGWVTAKAGRPDANRAGNALLRALAEGRIRWGFWPPGVPIPEDTIKPSHGIWLGHPFSDEEDIHSDTESEASADRHPEDRTTDDATESEVEEHEDGDDSVDVVAGGGRFGALALDDQEEDEDEDENGSEDEDEDKNRKQNEDEE
ncbi:hypothetical protein M422DRAFT_174008 [Sphaerobolus stellatus SS14]|uniref:Guanine nucleotide-binding protein-like 1 n=1 Tax=Sphaerobolus stellatus (strain SS14) TaxID=990650 RepID=A0A0C9VQZ6_SPHS4|nr:hypothetical protein M422DRAFT_174008 [Sphaerobolus stellatus SS14]